MNNRLGLLRNSLAIVNVIMGRKCFVKSCKVEDAGNRSFFQFPTKDRNRCLEWISVLGCDISHEVDIESFRFKYVCERHFKSTDIKKFLNKKTLIKKCIPSEFLSHEELGNFVSQCETKCTNSNHDVNMLDLGHSVSSLEVDHTSNSNHDVNMLDLGHSVSSLEVDHTSKVSISLNNPHYVLIEQVSQDVGLTEFTAEVHITMDKQENANLKDSNFASSANSDGIRREKVTGRGLKNYRSEPQKIEQQEKCFVVQQCSAVDCENNNLNCLLFPFPSVYTKSSDGKNVTDMSKLIRCREWVKKSGNEDLLCQPPGKLNNQFYICQEHFKVSDLSSKMKNTLKRNVIPSQFSCSSLSDEIMSVYDFRWSICSEEFLVDLVSDMLQDRNSTDSTKDVLSQFDEICDESEKGSEDCSSECFVIENQPGTCESILNDEKNEHSKAKTDDGGIIDHHRSCQEQVSTSKEKRKCCFVNCRLNGKKFAFPNIITKQGTIRSIDPIQIERCFRWLRSSGNSNLLRITPPNLHKVAYVCAAHFEKNQFKYETMGHLKDTAVPQNNSSIIEEEEMSKYMRHFAWYPGKCVEDYVNVCNEVEYALCFEDDLMKLNWFFCENCKEKQLKTKTGKPVCSNHGKCNDYSEQNNMDPGVLPPELQGLTFIEEQLIARVHPLVSVYRLKHGQFGYSGNVISFPQDISELAKELPHKLKDLSSVVRVKFDNDQGDFHEFRVRSKRVYNALKWLVKNNEFYKDVVISDENLSHLPEDSNMTEEIKAISLSSESEEISQPADFESKTEPYLHHSGVPSNSSVHPDDQINVSLNWPTMGSVPINEFKTKGYIACAFPTLFPSGKADLRDVREKFISPSRYFKHMLRYHDDRFAQHVTFRFFAMNSLMRWTALTDGSVMVQNSEEFKNMTSARLKELLKDNPGLIKKIIFRASNIRGTKPFWKSRCSELQEMVTQLGLPTIFLTLSFADRHCKDLFRLLTDKDVDSLTERERNVLLQRNPLIVDAYFTQRVDSFIQKVLKPKFNVVDMWYRIEYQHRGAPHIHGLFWFADAPDMSKYDTFNEEDKRKAKEYFDNLICAVNPGEDSEEPEKHPCRMSFEESMDNEQDLAQLINTVQKHSRCSTAYCLRRNKKTQQVQCRFKFPIPTEHESRFDRGEDGRLEFLPQRDDRYLNKFNKYISQVWRANIDIAPVTSKEALIAYLVKYIGKSEVSSQGMDEVLQEILLRNDDNDSVKNAVQSLFIRVCAERDFSAQEVCRIVMGEKLYSSGGRKFVHVNLSPTKDWIPLNEDNEERQGKKQKSIIEKYITRPATLENVSLWQATTMYNLNNWKKIGRKNIVLVFPKYTLTDKTNSETAEKYYRQEVLLHCPWRDENKFIDNGNVWKETYVKHAENLPDHCLLDLNCAQNDEDDLDETEVEQETLPMQEWQLLSKLSCKSKLSEIELGVRDVDINHNWKDIPAKYAQYGDVKEMKSFIKMQKLACKDKETISVNNFPDVTFNKEQEKVVNLIKKQVKLLENSEPNVKNVHKRTIVQGKAGTGKSLLIKYIKDYVTKKLGEDALMIVAPTGIAALQVEGETIHRAFQIKGEESKFKKLNEDHLRNFSNKMEKVKFLILDEYSMVGCGLLAMIDQRCKQGKNNQEDFGGLFVYFLGDICQLPPVLDIPVYSNNIKSRFKLYGKTIFNSFNAVVMLKESQRQQCTKFQSILDGISRGMLSKEDFAVLEKRFVGRLNAEEKKQFDNSIRLFPTRKQVHDHNMAKLRHLVDESTGDTSPVARIPAWNNCKEASMASTDDAEGLSDVIYLAKGCKIMLKANLWTSKGLVNGAIGTVVDILYDHDEEPPNGIPTVILCNFESYSGPEFIPNTKILPIEPDVKSWEDANEVKCKRRQFPLQLCYACSIHKSQGLTLSKVVVDLGDAEFALGLAYVALSRVKSIDDLMMEKFDQSRITKLAEYPSMLTRLKFEHHLNELATRTIG